VDKSVRRRGRFVEAGADLLSSPYGMCRFFKKGGDPMSSRLLSIAAVVVFTMASGAALACAGAKAKSADGSQQQSVPTASQARGS
jgi:hypothetical protein